MKILVDIPECAIVRRVNAQRAVIAPAIQAVGLRPRAFDNAAFGFERAQWIARNTSRIAHRRMDAAAGSAVAEANVSGLIHGRATHPPVSGVRCKGSQLIHAEDCVCRNCGTQFIPADTLRGGMIEHHGLVIAEVAVGQAVHGPVAQRVELVVSAGLRDARATAAEFAERSD